MAESTTIDLDLVPLALQAARENLECAHTRRDAAEDEIKTWELKVERLEGLIESNDSVVGNLIALRARNYLTPTGRIPHGHSEQLITTFLRTRLDTGATLREMSEATGVKYPTAHRLVKILEQRGRVQRDAKSCWRLLLGNHFAAREQKAASIEDAANGSTDGSSA